MLIRRPASLLTAVVVIALGGCGNLGKDSAAPASEPTVITSTTKIAGAGVLGNQRRPDDSCAPDPLPADPSDSPTRPVRHAAGETVVKTEPERIVVLSGDPLDTLCALGLQSRIVGAALPDGSTSQPSYLGTVIHDLPAVGTRSEPDLNAIRAANPDLILGSEKLTPQAYPEIKLNYLSPDLNAIRAASPDLILGSQGLTAQDYGPLSAIAPTVFTGAPGAVWEDNLRTVGAASGRTDAANGLIDDFAAAADKTGAENDAAHFQASVVQLTDTAMRVFGPDSFPGSVLADVGVDRPAAQRFTDKPYVEIGTSETDVDNSPDFSAADGDILYVSFASSAAKDRAAEVMGSDAWRKLSATKDNRVFVVNNEVWQTGQGIVAARGMLGDLRWVNAPIN